jgi:PKD repeat protein
LKHSKSLKLVLPILLILLMGIGILSGCFGNLTTPSPTVPAGEEKVLLRTTYKEINLDEGNFSIEIICSLNQYGLNASGFNYIYYDSEGVEITELSNFIGIPFDVVPSTLIGSPGSPTEVNNIPLYFNEVENYFIANPDVKQISCTVNLIGTDSLGNEITELIMSNIPIIESGVEHQEVNAVIQTTPNPPTGEVPLTVSFDAGASTTEDARGVAKYCWHFGDGSHGTCFDCSCPSELECPMHTYEEPGTYIATLCVWDYNDNLDCAAVVVTVNALQMNMTITANPATIAPKETSTISAYLTDQYDNPIPDGTKVAFYTTDGTLSAVFADTVDGIATVVLTLNEPVIATVTAVCDDASGSIIVRAVELGITVTADPVTISPGDFSTISAYLVDTFGEQNYYGYRYSELWNSKWKYNGNLH